jgi:hypothetical protein
MDERGRLTELIAGEFVAVLAFIRLGIETVPEPLGIVFFGKRDRILAALEIVEAF